MKHSHDQVITHLEIELGFTEHIFPQSSRPYLALVADIGLCLFLFLIGLEIEGSVVKRNARLSATIALAGMALPFGLGAALSVPLYKHFIPEEVVFTNFVRVQFYLSSL
jgi:Kef-type K+ transport system membrane component KefB